MTKKLLSFLLFSLLLMACHKSPNSTLFNSQNQPSFFVSHSELKNYTAQGKEYAIASQGKGSTKAAKTIFDQGGNIFDAAVALSFAISVERLQSTGLGGGGFMLLHDAKKNETLAIDFREKAPLTSHARMFVNQRGAIFPGKSVDGALSIATPGLVAGLLHVHQNYGNLPLGKVMAPAISIAEKGFTIYPHLAKSIQARQKLMREFEGSLKLFFNEKHAPLKEGETLKNPDLAKVLREIAKKGHKGFYEGWVAKAIVDEVKKHAGILSLEDFKQYKAIVRKPIRGSYKGYEVASMPPPSSGGVHIIQILNVLEYDPLQTWGPYSPKTIHKVASAMELAFYDRARYLGDTDFVNVPLGGLASKKYAAHLRKKIPARKALNIENSKIEDAFRFDHDDTTHFSIIDKSGNVVVSTQSINARLGSGLVAPGTGIVLNDHMDDFSAKVGAQNIFGAVGSNANKIEPEKRPLSSMSPTIIFKDNKPVLALGSPNGTRIISCVTLTALNYIEHKMNVFDSVRATRYHHQWKPDSIRLDQPFLPKDLQAKLKKAGHTLDEKPYSCFVQAVARENSLLKSASDPRGQGSAWAK